MASILYKGGDNKYPPSQSWTPSFLTTFFWFDAAYPNTLLLSSSSVQAWFNLASGNALSQSNPSSLPTYNSNGLNGLGTLSFNGSSQFLTSSITGVSNFSVFFVARNTRASIVVPVIDNIIAFNNFPSSPNNQGIGINSSNAYGSSQRQIFAESAGAGASFTRRKNGETTPLTLNQNEWFIGSVEYSNVPNQSSRVLQVGVLNVNNSVFFYGQNDLAEIVGFNTSVSTENRQKIEGYLAHKWGLASGLNSLHPYKTTPPLF